LTGRSTGAFLTCRKWRASTRRFTTTCRAWPACCRSRAGTRRRACVVRVSRVVVCVPDGGAVPPGRTGSARGRNHPRSPRQWREPGGGARRQVRGHQHEFHPDRRGANGTRSGDLDPGLLWYLARTEGLDARRFNEMVNFQSGLLGVSETSSDMQDLLVREAQDVRAAEASRCFATRSRSGSAPSRPRSADWTRWCSPVASESMRPDSRQNLRRAGIPGNRARSAAERGE